MAALMWFHPRKRPTAWRESKCRIRLPGTMMYVCRVISCSSLMDTSFHYISLIFRLRKKYSSLNSWFSCEFWSFLLTLGQQRRVLSLFPSVNVSKETLGALNPVSITISGRSSGPIASANALPKSNWANCLIRMLTPSLHGNWVRICRKPVGLCWNWLTTWG